jgi:signal transduction histidine kinase
MARSTRLLPAWITPLLMALLFGSVVLRAVNAFRQRPQLAAVLGVQFLWLVLLVIEPWISRRWRPFFGIYLALQAAPVLVLIGLPVPSSGDYFALLFTILSLQVMQRLPPRLGAACLALFALLTALPLVQLFGPAAAAGYLLIYLAANTLLGFYALANRRADEARSANERLAAEVDRANDRLRHAADQREQLAVARARHALARELHDSVTQTVFSMTLATESALLLLERQPARLPAQLDHLADLARSALAQMQTLISELKPEMPAPGGLEAALRLQLAERRLPQGLAITVKVEGDGTLDASEERALSAIAREAVNNIVKHAQASRASIRLHLTDPCWMEVSDDGRGFAPERTGRSGGVGLEGMRERAEEIGWNLAITSSPGRGTRLTVTPRTQGRSPA